MGVIQMIGQHAQKPSGFLGRLLARVMTRATLPQSGWTAQMLQVRPVDHLVDVGFGNGASIEHFATLASDGRVVGVDVSDTMIAVAARRNAGAIADGPGDPTSRRPSPSKRPSLSQRRGDCCVHPVVWRGRWGVAPPSSHRCCDGSTARVVRRGGVLRRGCRWPV